MPGAYVALPEPVIVPVKPPGWKSNWEFPGPDPPGYESVYELNFLNPPTQVNAGDTSTFTAQLATLGSDGNPYVTSEPTSVTVTWSQTP
jgi:hypothetical protein